MSITIELPEPIEQELAASWGIPAGELPRRVLELVAAEGYRKGALSHHEVSQLLLSRLHAGGFGSDRQTLKKLLG